MHQTTKGVSVVLCCYNSAGRLPDTLGHLFVQEVPAGLPWEIIVVDNNSTDDTAAVALRCWEGNGRKMPFHIVKQPAPGLSNARDKGVEEAGYDYILFCDDDNWLDRQYVANAFVAMEAGPDIGVMGGLAIAEPQPPLPAWFEKRISHYAVGDQARFAADGWVYGAGSICRKQILTGLKEKGWRQVTSDRLGDVYLYGGDNEICYMTKLLGNRIVYNETLTFRHFIPQERLHEQYIEKSAYGSCLSEFFLYPYFYYLSKRFSRKSGLGFFIFFVVYYGKNLLEASGKRIFSRGGDAYQVTMNKLRLRAALKFLPNTGKVFRQFRLIRKILRN